ncbi:MAG: site-specific integrase, partial [Proteobacteria bacterium]|nr:site-specific integrase [Pseudomonadota bacterium]
MIRRLAEIEEEARRHEAVIFTFEEAALRYLEEIAHKSSANTIAVILDRLFPYIGK